MAAQTRTREIIESIKTAVIELDSDRCIEWCDKVVEEGVNANDAVVQGLAGGMEVVADLYAKKEYFVPELLLSSDALYAGLDILKPHIKLDEVKVSGKVLMGVIEGDIHDIGKNLVKAMFVAAGWNVIDMGKDVKLNVIIEGQIKEKADIVALSALMTSSMLAMPKAIQMLRDADPNVKIMIGGAPITADIAKQYGADGYAGDAVSAVKKATELIKAEAIA